MKEHPSAYSGDPEMDHTNLHYRQNGDNCGCINEWAEIVRRFQSTADDDPIAESILVLVANDRACRWSGMAQ